MIAWWAARSRREHVLLAVLAVIALGAAGWFGVIQPLRAAADGAERRLSQARLDEALVRNAAAEIRRLEAEAPPAPAGDLAGRVEASAETAGLALVRVEPQADGALQVVVSGASQALTPWLMRLQREEGAVLRHLTLVKGEAGLLDADITLAAAGS